MPRRELSDTQWNQLEPHLPPQKPDVGRPNKEHRRIIDGILWVLRTGAPWRDLPEAFGPWQTVYSRFRRWCENGTWQRIYDELQEEADQNGDLDWLVHFVDSSIVRAHQHSAGAPKKGAKTRPSDEAEED